MVAGGRWAGKSRWNHQRGVSVVNEERKVSKKGEGGEANSRDSPERKRGENGEKSGRFSQISGVVVERTREES